MANPKIDYLQHLHDQSVRTSRLVENLTVVTSLTPEGLKDLATSHPDVVLKAFDVLGDLIQNQRETINSLAEDWMSALDALERIAQMQQ